MERMVFSAWRIWLGQPIGHNIGIALHLILISAVDEDIQICSSLAGALKHVAAGELMPIFDDHVTCSMVSVIISFETAI